MYRQGLSQSEINQKMVLWDYRLPCTRAMLLLALNHNWLHATAAAAEVSMFLFPHILCLTVGAETPILIRPF